MLIRRLSWIGVSVVVLSSAAQAFGQDNAVADALFKKGVDAIAARNFEVACPAIAESNQLDPRPGTLFTLADCERQRGRIATAAKLFDDYLQLVAGMKPDQKKKHADRAKEAEAQKIALAKDIPTLTIVVPQGAPENAKVLLDGTERSAAERGIPLPMDPGEHVVEFDVPGAERTKKTITLKVGDKTVLDVEMPVIPKADPIVHVDKPQEKTKADVFVVKPKGAEKPSNGLRTGGFVGLGLGAAGFVLLGVTGGMALQKKSVFDEKCPNNLCTAKADQDGWHEGRTMANVSTVGAVVGVAGVVAGTVMLVMGKGGAEKRAAKPGVHIAVMDAGPTGGLFGVKGVF